MAARVAGSGSVPRRGRPTARGRRTRAVAMPENQTRSDQSRTVDLAGRVVALALGGVSWLRGGKAVHPHGEAYRGRLSIDGSPAAPSSSPLLTQPAEHDVVVRVSRSIGLPSPLPDLLGVAVRVLDAYGPGRDQDLLMISSIDLPVLHHFFVPATDIGQRVFSSSLPYRSGEERVLIGARATPDSPRPRGGDPLRRLREAARTGRPTLELLVARLGGRFERVGELTIELPMPPATDALTFNPFNSGPGLEPAGRLSDWRRAAYPRSQSAWGSTDSRRVAQSDARAAVRSVPRRESDPDSGS